MTNYEMLINITWNFIAFIASLGHKTSNWNYRTWFDDFGFFRPGASPIKEIKAWNIQLNLLTVYYFNCDSNTILLFFDLRLATIKLF